MFVLSGSEEVRGANRRKLRSRLKSTLKLIDKPEKSFCFSTRLNHARWNESHTSNLFLEIKCQESKTMISWFSFCMRQISKTFRTFLNSLPAIRSLSEIFLLPRMEQKLSVWLAYTRFDWNTQNIFCWKTSRIEIDLSKADGSISPMLLNGKH